ncbi:MAG: hypothetical protein KDA88_11720 [Planctomycetaceae bacterium]|nr:hypothetical protein [Planctomycetaceae bacterium]
MTVEEWDLEYSFEDLPDGLVRYVHNGVLDDDMRDTVLAFQDYFRWHPQPDVPPPPITMEEARRLRVETSDSHE